eukprot:9137051-Pyramimonas_sp.AAC.1
MSDTEWLRGLYPAASRDTACLVKGAMMKHFEKLKNSALFRSSAFRRLADSTLDEGAAVEAEQWSEGMGTGSDRARLASRLLVAWEVWLGALTALAVGSRSQSLEQLLEQRSRRLEERWRSLSSHSHKEEEESLSFMEQVEEAEDSLKLALRWWRRQKRRGG